MNKTLRNILLCFLSLGLIWITFYIGNLIHLMYKMNWYDVPYIITAMLAVIIPLIIAGGLCD